MHKELSEKFRSKRNMYKKWEGEGLKKEQYRSIAGTCRDDVRKAKVLYRMSWKGMPKPTKRVFYLLCLKEKPRK